MGKSQLSLPLVIVGVDSLNQVCLLFAGNAHDIHRRQVAFELRDREFFDSALLYMRPHVKIVLVDVNLGFLGHRLLLCRRGFSLDGGSIRIVIWRTY